MPAHFLLLMRYLIILQSLCAEMHGLADWLARQPQADVLLALERSNHYPDIPAAGRIILKKPEHRALSDSLPAWLIACMHRAEKAAYSLRLLAEGSRKPDLILAYSSNGIGFNPRATFPDAFVVNYLCDLSSCGGAEKEAATLLEDMQMRQADLTLAFQGRHPVSGTEFVPYIVDTVFFAPPAIIAQEKRLETVIWLRDSDEEKFRLWLQTIIAVLGSDRRIHIHVLAPNMHFVHMIREYVSAIPRHCAERLSLSCFPHRKARKELFTRTSLFINPSRTLNLDLLEAMSCGVPAISCAPLDGFAGWPGAPERPSLEELMTIIRSSPDFALAGSHGREYILKYHSEDVAAPIHLDKIRAAMALRAQGKAGACASRIK